MTSNDVRPGAPALRAIRTARSGTLEKNPGEAFATLVAHIRAVYFEGKLDLGLALTGQVAGRIDAIRPVAEILADTVREYHETVARLSR